MMSTHLLGWSVLTLVVMTMLALLWIRGFDAVKGTAPDRLPLFYYATAILRVVVVLTIILVFRLLYGTSEIKTFAAIVLGMYAVMLTVSIIIKHK